MQLFETNNNYPFVFEKREERKGKFHPPLDGDLLNPLVQFSARSIVQSSVSRGGRG